MFEVLSESEFKNLIARLVSLPAENEYVEFKENNSDPDMIGQTVSALANGALISNQQTAFFVWGISDSPRRVVGTSFDPGTAKGKGNEDLYPWLRRVVNPAPVLHFQAGEIEGQKVILLRIAAAKSRPVSYRDVRYVREGSYNKKLIDFPDLEARLFRSIQSFSFESEVCRKALDGREVLELLDSESYYDLTQIPEPQDAEIILRELELRRFISHSIEHNWSITNLGALLYAKDLSLFPGLKGKIPRVVLYDGPDRTQTVRDMFEERGYAAGFRELLSYISISLPSREVIGESGLRHNEHAIPLLVIRELVANALVHQDLTNTEINLIVEIFSDRIEVLNPGDPLIPSDRFIDWPSSSRNPALAEELYRIGVIEKKGSGWDKIAAELEKNHLPGAKIQTGDGYTRVSISGPRNLNEMSKEEVIAAVYQHACLNHVNDRFTNNASICSRFRIPSQNKAKASRIINDAKEAGKIVAFDETVGNRSLRYVPFWAKENGSSP